MPAKGGFTLTKFVSNLRDVLSTLNRMEIPVNGNVKALAAEDESSHVLGLKWKYQFDTIVVNRGTSPSGNCTLTQRFVLSLVSALYDPIGLVVPYTVKARLLLQDIWRLGGQQWDGNLPDNIADKLLERFDESTRLTEIKTISRSYFDGQLEKVELHNFGDRSQGVLLSVVFLLGNVTRGSYGKTELAFEFGKA